MVASFARKLFVVVAVVALGVAAGCEKEVKMSFQNSTDDARVLMVSGPGKGTGLLGTVAPYQKVTTRIKVDEDFLPATYTWDAGDQDGTFTIDKDSKSPQMVVIQKDGSMGPIDKDTEVHEDTHLEVEDMIIEQDTVVE